MIAYKLMRRRRDGTLGPLFINRRQRIILGEKYVAEDHPTKGYKHRPGWHACMIPLAPHLSEKDRVWVEVRLWHETEHRRPESQGGVWYTAKFMQPLRVL